MKAYEAEVSKWNSRRRLATGIPGELTFSVAASGTKNLSLAVEVAPRGGGTGLRRVDVWMMAMVAWIEQVQGGRKISELAIDLKGPRDASELESFRRRISYLALNNGWSIAVKTPAGTLPLARTWPALFTPSSVGGVTESIHQSWKSRANSADRDGAIEKMLQTWLAGVDRKSSHRLAVLGPDFIYGASGKTTKVVREFPTGSFTGAITKRNRILPTYWVDLVTMNCRRELALVELKISDSKLEVMAQALDYALFFRTFRAELLPVLQERVSPELKEKARIVCYVVNNRFHAHFDAIGPYYRPQASGSSIGFGFKKVVLGGTSDL
jgi:hypothetical protein